MSAVRDRTCSRKVRHPTYRAAQEEAERLRKMHGAKLLMPYRCFFCRFYHVGSYVGVGRTQREG